MMMSRTPQQEAEENMVLEQAKVIEAGRRAEDAQRQAAAPQGAPMQAASESSAALRRLSLLLYATPAPVAVVTTQQTEGGLG